jgi:hypothetical protein
MATPNKQQPGYTTDGEFHHHEGGGGGRCRLSAKQMSRTLNKEEDFQRPVDQRNEELELELALQALLALKRK